MFRLVRALRGWGKHNPAEAIGTADVDIATRVLLRFTRELPSTASKRDMPDPGGAIDWLA